ncbi:MAG: hypothetical protein KF819_32185 [Labilithrix sp.]|nr:hypothetical protein [Labilithrix sp.]
MAVVDGDLNVGLIGREREQAQLLTLVVGNRVVSVYGGAGIGKTSLVLDVCRAAARERKIPDVVNLSLLGTSDPREALERTAKAMGEPRPTPEPDRVAEALASLLTRAPRTVIWDDLDDRTHALGDLVRRVAAAEGPARLVLVSRRLWSALRAPSLEVKPLGMSDAIRLVRALEEERGRTLAEDLADASGGNPLLVRLALAETALPRVAASATDALRRSVEEHASGPARRVLSLLTAAEGALDETELLRAAGRGAREALAELRKYLLVVQSGSRIAIAAPAMSLAQSAIGEPDEATWRSLARIAGRALAASGHDDAALLMAARANLELGDVDECLRVVREHGIARAAAEAAAIERLLRDVASRSRAHAATALRLLARELLRVGDYEAARRTLDEMPPAKTREEAERVALLRAETHIRAGEPEAAQRALDALDYHAKGKTNGKRARRAADDEAAPRDLEGALDDNAGVALTRAQLAVLRGELAAARGLLERLAPRTMAVPQLEARRAVEIAASHLYEERYDLTHAWTMQARAAQKAGGIPIERVVTIIDVHALLGLGDVDRVEELLARESRGRPDGGNVLEIGALVRRGAHARALEIGDAAVAALDRRSDLLFRSVLARDLVRACIGTGQLARGERMLRLAEAAGDEPGLAALRPICDAERARLAEAAGDMAKARRSNERAYARIPTSPFVEIDRDVLNGRVPSIAFTPPSKKTAKGDADLPAIARAYAALRGAELLLSTGKLVSALEAAEIAERHYANAHLWFETARARLARGEALARLHREEGQTDAERQALRERAEQALAGCEEVAAPNGYVPLLVGAALVRAALGESSGDLDVAARALAAAVKTAGDGVDAALARAASRLGLSAPEPRGSESAVRRPYEARIERLGLLRPADVVWRVGTRTYLSKRDEGPPELVACTVDLEDRRVRAGADRELELPEQRIALLSALAEAGEGGASLEEIFARVWGGSFHPLRHRNAVYVALARLKDSLKPLAREVRVAHDGDRYRLAGDLPVAVRRKADRRGLREAMGQHEAPWSE